MKKKVHTGIHSLSRSSQSQKRQKLSPVLRVYTIAEKTVSVNLPSVDTRTPTAVEIYRQGKLPAHL